MGVYGIASLVVTVLACGFAAWKGGRTEQTGATACLIIGFVMLFAQQDTGTLTPKYVLFALDLILFLVFVGLAWKSPRGWPMFAAAFQMIKIVAHVASLMNLKIGTFAYLSALNLADYGVLTTLAIGAWSAWREREALNYATR